MAVEGGSIHPFSAFPSTGDGAPGFHVISTTNFIEGLKVAASITTDIVWHLAFKMPPTLPSGTMKLVLELISAAITGNAKVNPSWEGYASGEVPADVTGSAEGVSTIASPTTANQLLVTKITLDAGTIAAADILYMQLLFDATSWTLASVSTWMPSVIWE